MYWILGTGCSILAILVWIWILVGYLDTNDSMRNRIPIDYPEYLYPSLSYHLRIPHALALCTSIPHSDFRIQITIFSLA